MKENFHNALAFVIKWEGGYSHDKDDPGGETKWGISKKAHPDLDIRSLNITQAGEIYRNGYWDKCQCDSIPWPGDLIVFDSAVNCGPITACRWKTKAEGNWTKYLSLREDHYRMLVKSSRRMSKFFNGWMNRVNDLREAAGLA